MHMYSCCLLQATTRVYLIYIALPAFSSSVTEDEEEPVCEVESSTIQSIILLNHVLGTGCFSSFWRAVSNILYTGWRKDEPSHR